MLYSICLWLMALPIVFVIFLVLGTIIANLEEEGR
jgi:hypothetical protein